jgi:hypothetical protein
VRVPLALTGKWVRGATTFEISRRDLEEIVRNFRERQNGEINVDYDHASEMPEVAAGGPIPSAGRIVRLDPPEAAGGSGESGVGNRKTPDSRFILYGWYEPTARARELLKNREYRFLSPALEWDARSKRTGQTQGTTLTSVALTNRPFLEELPQIRLSDPAFLPVEEVETRSSRFETGNSKLKRPSKTPGQPISNRQFAAANHRLPVSHQGANMKFATPSVADGKIRLTHADFSEDFFLDPEELRKCLEQLGLAAPAALMSEAGASPITLAEARTLLSEAEGRGKFIPAAEFFRAQVEQELEAAVKAGRILPRQRDDWRKIALADLVTFRRVLAAQKPQVPLAPLGLSGGGPADVRAQVKGLAEQRMRERGLTYGQALSELGREQPDLVEQYRRAVSGNE